MATVKVYRANNTFDLNDFDVREKEYLQKEIILNSNSDTLKETTYNEFGDIESIYEFEYDENNRLVKELLTEEGEIVGNKSITYNESGKIKTEKEHYIDDSYDMTTYHYAENGDLISTETIDNENIKTKYTLAVYSNNKVTKYSEYDEDDNLVFSQEINYNEKLQPTEEVTTAHGETITKVMIYDDANLVQLKTYNSEEQLKERLTWEYDSSGKIMKSIEENVNGIEISEFQYNENGMPILQVVKDENDIVTQQIERTFDEQNRPLIVSINIQAKNSMPSIYYRLRYEYL